MSTSLHLVVVAEDTLWPGLQCFAHFLSTGETLTRLSIYQSAAYDLAISPGDALERLARVAQPEMKLELKRGTPTPADLRAQLASWITPDDPDQRWVICLDNAAGWEAWGIDPWLGRENIRVWTRSRTGGWTEWIRDDAGNPAAKALPDIQRGVTDRFMAADLIRAVTPAGSGSWQVLPPPTAALPLVPVVQAAIQNDWHWRNALASVQLEVGAATESTLFQWFIADLIRIMLREGASIGRGTIPPENAGARRVEWISIHAGGRFIIIDTFLGGAAAPQDSDAESDATWIAEMDQAVRLRSRLKPLSPEWILLRPTLRCRPATLALAESRGLQLVDEPAMSDLPSRLAELLDLPLPAEGAEIERLLKAHLAGTGRVRLFGPEPEALRQQRAANADPLYLNADLLLDRIQRDRRQNWLLWVQGERAFFRLPAEEKARPTSDWCLLVAGIGGLDPSAIRTLSKAGSATVLEWEENAEAGDRVRDWLRPFLNSRLTFAAAQERFAAKARVLAEAPASERRVVTPVPPPSAAATHPKPTSRAPQPAKRPERRPQPPERPSRDSLIDLDQVLDAALNPKKPT
ncbi:MAG: hypothetical protein JNK85_04065 [Verrucomicrobiales bacterium]|nr:hypothetical protein [Verrucomicrobiales bacterium]